MIKRQSKPIVILIHGLHMHAWAMRPLAKKLTKLGYECHRFGYFSVAHNLANHSRRLHRWLTKHEKAGVPIYLVGHSLGGLVIRDFLQRYPQWQITCCVTLGTPHNGSISANNIVKILPKFVGRSYLQGLDGNVPALKDTVQLGSIAGVRSVGLGKVVLPRNRELAKLEPHLQPNDGTVFVHETQLAAAKDHIIVNASHTGLLINDEVAIQIHHFLQQGHFLHTKNC